MQKANDNTQASNQTGIVISYFGNSVAVECQNGQIVHCHLRRNQSLPVVGDHVQWQWGNDESGIIIAIDERRTILARGDKRGNLKPIVANIDTMLITMAPPPIFAEYLVDRYLVAAEILKIQAVIVLNKFDILKVKERKLALARLAPYKEIPYPVITTSVVKKNGLRELDMFMQGRAGVLVGPSGVGKSSIISSLSKQDIRVGDVTEKGSGKHTTTATRLYHLPQGGHLIDSPGVREFSLWSVTKSDILASFTEFKPYLNGCKFRDCQHLVEPDCAVQKAVEAGKISPIRYNNYQILLKQASL